MAFKLPNKYETKLAAHTADYEAAEKSAVTALAELITAMGKITVVKKEVAASKKNLNAYIEKAGESKKAINTLESLGAYEASAYDATNSAKRVITSLRLSKTRPTSA